MWRIFLYDRNDDDTLAQIHGLPSLKEVWLMGSRITDAGKEEIKGRLPDIKYHE